MLITYIVDVFNIFIEKYWSFNIGILSVFIVCAICTVLTLLVNTQLTCTRDYNSDTGSYADVYRTVALVYLKRFISDLYSLYMSLWVIYMVVNPLNYIRPDDIKPNAVWIALMCIAAILIFLNLIRQELFAVSEKTFFFIGGIVLVCKMFSDIYYEYSDHFPFIYLIIICLFSWISVKLRRFYEDEEYSTINYFTMIKDIDTFVTAELTPGLFGEIVRNIPVIDKIKDGKSLETIDPINTFFNVRKKRAFYNNDTYLKSLEEAKSINYVKDYEKCSNWAERLAEETNKVIECEIHKYSSEKYKVEAIKKVFDALGYCEKPTTQNYTKLRKTVELLKIIYSCKISEQNYYYGKEFAEEYAVISNGIEGEKIVLDAIAKMKERYRDMQVLENFRFNYSDGSSVECDLLIITTGGIYCIEVKNYGQNANYILEISANGTWYKRYGEQLHQMDSDPFRQNSMHATALVQKFGKEFASLSADGTVPQIYELVVVPNNIEIHNSSLNRVFHVGGLCEFIITEAKKFDKKSVDEVAQCLRKNSLPAQTFEHTDFVTWAKDIDELYERITLYINLSKELSLSKKYKIL